MIIGNYVDYFPDNSSQARGGGVVIRGLHYPSDL